MTGDVVTFGEALSGPRGAEVRQRLPSLLDGRPPGPLHVDSLPALAARLSRGELPSRIPGTFLLLDLRRIVVFTEPPGPEAPGLDSLVRALADDATLPPPPRVLEHVAESLPLLHPAAVLDVLALLWPLLRPGHAVCADLASGEISVDPVPPHPEASAPGACPPPPEPPRDRWTDDSLRASPPVAVEDLVSPTVGPVRWRNASVDAASLPFATTRIAWDGGRSGELCFGKALRPADAARVAVYEALERCHVVFRPAAERLLHGTHREMGADAVDPRALFFGRRRAPSGEWVAPFSDDVPLYWTRAYTLAGRPALVPAQEVWFRTEALPGENLFVRTTTSGCALGGSFEEAAIFALLELVERDGFLTTWYLRRRCARIDPASIADEPFQLLRRRWEATFPGYAFHLLDATNDTGIPTVLGVAVKHRGEGPHTFFAAASRLSPVAACRAALKDLTGFVPHLSETRRDELRLLLREPSRVREPQDHFGTYALEEAFSRLEFLGFGEGPGMPVEEAARGSQPGERGRHNLREVLEGMAARLEEARVAVLLKDLTHPALRGRLRCVRAIAPGLFPIWFGADALRFSLTSRLRRLSAACTGRAVEEESDCQLEIHPFA